MSEQDNFFNDPNADYPQEDAAGFVVNEIEESETQPEELYSEALKRLEKAQLYKTIINHSIFAPNSARPEIQVGVEQEIREFALSRLETLLGVGSDKPKVSQASDFTPDEVQALKAVAARVAGASKKSEPSPVINQTASAAPARPQVQPIQPPQYYPATKASQHPAAQAKPKAKAQPARRRRSDNVSEKTGKDYSAAKVSGGLPMPNQASQNSDLIQKASFDPNSKSLINMALQKLAPSTISEAE